MLSPLTAGALGGHFVTCGEPSPWQRVPETSLGAPLLSTVYLVVPAMLGVWEVSAYKSLGAERAVYVRVGCGVKREPGRKAPVRPEIDLVCPGAASYGQAFICDF